VSADPGSNWDLVVVGGGFYGCAIALHAVRRWRLQRVLLVEREDALMQRASWRNQARVHGGYHYPRSYTTAFRSRANYSRFLADWPDATRRLRTALYAIARHDSKVTARQFERFARDIDAPLAPAPADQAAWFDPRRIEAVYEVEEAVFDASHLASQAMAELAVAGIALALGTRVSAINASEEGGLAVDWSRGGETGRWRTGRVINCTYSGLASLLGDGDALGTSLKHEITEMALVRPPAALAEVAITVMDGPYFSLMPSPATGLHTLSHVRYTPHRSWVEDGTIDPYAALDAHAEPSRFERMRRDAALYVPMLASLAYERSLMEIKTVPLRNETDDGRPILFTGHPRLGGVYSVLGSKIDNIEDVLERLGSAALPAEGRWTR